MPLALLPFGIEVVVLKCSVENSTTLLFRKQYVVWKKVSNSTHSFDVKKNTKYENDWNMSHLKLCRMRLFIDIFKHFVKEKGKKGFLDELFLPIPPDILTGKLCKRRNLWNWSKRRSSWTCQIEFFFAWILKWGQSSMLGGEPLLSLPALASVFEGSAF